MNKDNLKKLFAGVAINSVEDVQSAFTKIVVMAFNFFWVAAVGMIIWAAYLFLSGGDNEQRIEKAKKILLYAVIAAAVALLANGINPIVTNILKGTSTNTPQSNNSGYNQPITPTPNPPGTIPGYSGNNPLPPPSF